MKIFDIYREASSESQEDSNQNQSFHLVLGSSRSRQQEMLHWWKENETNTDLFLLNFNQRKNIYAYYGTSMAYIVSMAQKELVKFIRKISNPTDTCKD